MGMKNCEKFNEAFMKAFNEAMKTDAGEKISKDLAMMAFCSGKTSKKAIKELKDGFVEFCFYRLLKDEKRVRDIFANCLYNDIRAEA